MSTATPSAPDADDGPALWPEARALVHALGGALPRLADELSATMFCAKDVTGRYVLVNDAFVRRTNERSRRRVVGRRATDLFVAPLAERYEQQDAGVLGTGRPLHREIELIRRPGGTPGWYVTSKLAVRSAQDGRVVGLMSVSEDLRAHDPADPVVVSLARATALVQERVADPPTVAELAAVVGCSTATLDRRVRRVFGLSPQQLVLRARVDHAATLLTDTDLPIAEVATACGFFDQAAFTRMFGRLAGETPAQFRRLAVRPAPRASGR